MKKFIVILITCIVSVIHADGLTYNQAYYAKNINYIRTASSNDPVYNFIGEIDYRFTFEAIFNDVTVAGDLDELSLEQGPHHGARVDAAHVLHFRARQGLSVGDDRQRLEGGIGNAQRT